MTFFCVAGALWDSLNVNIDLCRSMYKSYTETNGRDFPMMIGKSVIIISSYIAVVFLNTTRAFIG